MIVDLFAGPGGWDEGLRTLGVHDTIGIEWEKHECATRMAAGHATRQGDVTAIDPADYADADGLIASPPCQAFSSAGRGRGLNAIPALLDHVAACADGWVAPPDAICTDDTRADLTLEPLRWADALRPRWIALEQVPKVLPLWEAIGQVLEGWGYSVAVAKVNAADYGVPQTRKRAVLLARRDGIPAVIPEPTHYDPRKDGPALLGRPWVTMAEALGIGTEMELVAAGVAGAGVPTGADRPAPTITAKGTAAWLQPGSWADGRGGNRRLHDPASEPAPTLHFGNDSAGWRWVFERPSTTIVGSFRPDIVAAPGWRTDPKQPRQNTPGSVRVTVPEAGALQTFPADYPWQGPKYAMYRQVGNAVPPLLAASLLEQFVVTHPKGV